MSLASYHKKKGYSQERYITIPRKIALSPDYLSLSGTSVKVLNYLLTKYNGKNNGNLSLPKRDCSTLNIARATLTKALRELQNKEQITKTRQGIFGIHGAKCSLYAINWLPIDELKN